jgi:hypothetical protein
VNGEQAQHSLCHIPDVRRPVAHRAEEREFVELHAGHAREGNGVTAYQRLAAMGEAVA